MEKKVKQWLEQKDLPQELRTELLLMEQDPKWQRDAFYKELEFGTSGLRGIMGAGTNRMNLYVVRKVTQGLADHIKKKYAHPVVAIGYDSRIHSDDFAQETACVLCANGISVELFPEPAPVAALSFAVRQLGCCMGVMITASHNPKEYNGYKVYDETGCQIIGTVPDEILQACRRLDLFRDVKRVSREAALTGTGGAPCRMIEQAVLEEYIQCAVAQQMPWDEKLHMREHMAQLQVVYTPLNGVGRRFVETALHRLGVSISIPEAQASADGNFPTCPYPNPERKEAFAEGMALCSELGADLIFATDPDCDRVGAMVPQYKELQEKVEDAEAYRLLTGNELGILLLDFICRMRKESPWAKDMPERPVAIRSVVSTPFADKIAAQYGVETKVTLTGFKYICAYMEQLEAQGEGNRFLFGFEESNGYLPGMFVRDKDGVSTAVLLCQMAAWHKLHGRTLLDALEQISRQYGYYRNETVSIAFEGYEGAGSMKGIMDSFRNRQILSTQEFPVERMMDYLMQTGQNLPKADMLQIFFTEGSSCIIRPSGTEPKLKLYTFVWGETYRAAQEKSESMKTWLLDEIEERKKGCTFQTV